MSVIHHVLAGIVLCAAAGMVSGCSEAPERVAIAESVAPGLQEQRKPPVLPAVERLGMTNQAAQIVAGPEGSAPSYHYQVPPGWEELAPAQFRDVNLRVLGQPDSEIYLTVLPGGGGGVVQNINRWRAQMGAEPLTEEEVAALPKQSFMNQQGAFVEVRGTFSGMGNITPKEDFMLLGLAAVIDGQGYFLKMTGPAMLVEVERENFLRFAQSLHANIPGHSHGAPAAQAQDHDHDHEHGEDHNHDHAHAPAASGAETMIAAAELEWDAPEGWEQGPSSPMRLVTFRIPGVENAECYLSSLRGAGGGVEANLNRWRQQVGQPPMTPDEFAALPRIAVLGQEAPLLRVEGDFTGVDNVTHTGQMVLGVVVPAGEDTVFVKMTGPASVVSEEAEKFIAFCESLR